MIFTLCLMAGVFFLAIYRAPQNEGQVQVGSIEIWGTFSGDAMNTYLREMRNQNETFERISYREFSDQDFNQELLVALAEGRSPDLLLLSNAQVYQNRNRILALQPDVLSRRDYRNEYLEIAEAYYWNDGILGLPFIVDPMIMFWNRNIFTSAGLVNPPATWSEVSNLSTEITERDENLNITKATVAMGEARNVTYFKELLSTFALQFYNPITTVINGDFMSALAGDQQRAIPSAESAFNYFTRFSNTAGDSYTWNRSLPESETYFLGGNLALHFGFASDIQSLQMRNPNLNFDIAEMPQLEGTDLPSVYADLYGFFIPRGAPDANRAYVAMNLLTSSQSANAISEITSLTSARRDFSPSGNQDFTEMFRKEAVYARTFIDPDYAATNAIFQNAVENITSGRRSVSEALNLADAEIDAIISNN